MNRGCSQCGREYGHTFYYGDKDALHVLRELSQLSYSAANHMCEAFPNTFEIPQYLSYGDYDNSSLVEVSNHKVWCEQFSDFEGLNWWHVHGDYGTTAVMVRTWLLTTEQREFLDALNSYPVADESAWSELECERQWEDWKDYGESDFRHELVRHAQSLDCMSEDECERLETMLDNASHERMWELWRYMRGGEYPETEFEGQTALFRFEKDIKGWEGDMSVIEDGLYGEPVTDNRGVFLMLVHRNTLQCVRVIRELDGETGALARADVLETWLDVSTRQETSNYIIVPNDECGAIAANVE